MRKRIVHLAVLCLCALALSSCERATSTQQGQSLRASNSASYESPVRIAELSDPAVKESSGLVASRRNADIFWTHNDSGDDAVLYAFDRKGRNMGHWRVRSAKSYDWEDIAAGPGPQSGVSYLYIGDIGDNGSRRASITVYRIVEPSVTNAKEGEQATEEAEAIRLKYPDGGHDAEALLVHPLTGDLYIVTKNFGTSSGIYKLKAPFSTSAVNTLTRVGTISVPNLVGGLITGGDISTDGRRVVLCDYLSAYELSLPDSAAGDFDNIWKQPIESVALGPRRQGEAVCYSLDGQAILATSEKRPTPLIEVKRKN
ncbi:MAG TPA: hypothetical protein VF791_10665 [Pyrinomonadaceae bacterium]